MRVGMLVTNSGTEDPRVRMEAEALAEGGYDVTVVGWDRDSSRDSERRAGGVHFVRIGLPSTHGRGITQSMFMAALYLRSWGVLRRLRPAVIHCHDLDTLPLGWYAAGRLRTPLVFDAHDNFPDMVTGHLPAAAVRALRAVERWLVRRCDLLVTVGDLLAGHYRSMGAKRVVVVGNWKDPEAFRFSRETLRQTRRELGLSDARIAISYIANLGRERPVEPLLAAVAADDRFACVIGGDGPNANIVRQYARTHPSTVYLGRVPPDRIPLMTAACDVVYACYDEASLNARWGAPNKLYDAIAASKPLLANDLGEVGKLIRRTGCGVLVKTPTREAIGKALEQMASPAALKAMGQRTAGLQKTYRKSAAEQRLRNAYAAMAAQESRNGGAVCRGDPVNESRRSLI